MRRSDVKPNATERARVVDYLKGRGLDPGDVGKIVSPGRTRREISQALIETLRTLPKRAD